LWGRVRRGALGIALLGFLTRGALADLPEVVGEIKPSVVGIGTYQPARQPPGNFVGTGFVVADGRHVLTNAHNLPRQTDERYKEYLAVLIPGKKAEPRQATLIASDPKHDLALLQFQGTALPALALGDSQGVREGEMVAFTGFPIGMVLGMRPVTHRGIVSAITPIVIPQLSAEQLNSKILKRLSDPFEVFQLDATAYPGNSGSPLYQVQSGKVIGVLNMVFIKESKEHLLDKPSGISYAIPIEYAKKLLKSAKVPLP
jgi:S1-C subfamily serine protease